MDKSSIKNEIEKAESLELGYDPSIFGYQYMPDEILHRDEEIKALCKYVANAFKNLRSTSILVSGPPGTGKTSSVMTVLSVLPSDVPVVYVNCSEQGTKLEVLRRVLMGLGDSSLAKHIFPINTPDFLYAFQERIKGKRAVIVLDEVDLLFTDGYRQESNSKLFYGITRSTKGVVVIGIANDTSFTKRMDPRVYDTLAKQEIYFPSYTQEQAADIVWERLKTGFKQGSIDRETVCYAVANVFLKAESGGIRRCLDVFKYAAENKPAEEEAITREMVLSAITEIDKDHMNVSLERLSAQHIAVLLACVKACSTNERNKTVDIEMVYDAYVELCEPKGLEATNTDRFSGIVMYLKQQGFVDIRSDRTKQGMIKKVGARKIVLFDLEHHLEQLLESQLRQAKELVKETVKPRTPSPIDRKTRATPTKVTTDEKPREVKEERHLCACGDCGGFAVPGMTYIKGHASPDDVVSRFNAWLKNNGSVKDVGKYTLTDILEKGLGIPVEPDLSKELQAVLIKRGLRPKIEILPIKDTWGDGIDDDDIRSWVFDHKGAFKFMRRDEIFKASGLGMSYYERIEDMLEKLGAHVLD